MLDDFAGDWSGNGSRDDSRGDSGGVTSRCFACVGELLAVPEEDAPPASPRLSVPAGDFAYVAWRSTSDIRRGVSEPVPSLTRTPDRGCRVAPGTSSYGERGTRDRAGVSVVRTVAGRNGDGGGRPNVPAVDVGAPEVVVLRALGVALAAPEVLDVGIAPDRAPASRECARPRRAPSSARGIGQRASVAVVRRRCWVNPTNGWFGKNRDVLRAPSQRPADSGGYGFHHVGERASWHRHTGGAR